MTSQTTKDTLSNKDSESEMQERLGRLEAQFDDFKVMLGQHNKQIHRMSIIISDLLNKLESKGNQSI